jgi:hypothetical protein
LLQIDAEQRMLIPVFLEALRDKDKSVSSGAARCLASGAERFQDKSKELPTAELTRDVAELQSVLKAVEDAIPDQKEAIARIRRSLDHLEAEKRTRFGPLAVAWISQQRQTIQVSLTALRSLGRIILDDAISDEDLRAQLFAAVSREELVACVDKIGEWVTGKRSDLFHGIVRRHGMLRKFSPALLDALELTQDIEGEQTACLRALQMLKELNATGRRKLPEDAPTDFLSQRLKPIVINQGEIDRRAWECALLLKLRDELKAGNLSVRYSKRFAQLEEFFIDDRRWQSMREDFFRRSGLPYDSTQVPEYLVRRLGEAYERFLKTAPSNSYAVVDKDGWHLSAEPTEKLDQEGQDRLAHLKSWQAKHMRRVKLPDLLIEVDNQLGFTRNFLTPAPREEPSPEDISAVLAAVMAPGCVTSASTRWRS